MTDWTGRQLGNYRIVSLLGQGGFADVYLGEHLYLNSQAAIKVMHTHLAQEEWESFRKEARIIARLVHPHIVRLLDFDIEAGAPFLVMQLAPNGTLRRRHARGYPLAPAVILPYVRQVASALQYVHERRLVHRDIKPENLLIGSENEILLSDFGVAIIAQSSRQQSLQNVGGTVAYMAPEQIQSRPVPASDQYALGVVVYEWLTGERPFDGSFAELASKQLFAAPQPPRRCVPTISPAVEAVVLRALAKDPQERFPSVQAFAQALEEATDPNASTLIARRSGPLNSPYTSSVTPALNDSFTTRVLVSSRLPALPETTEPAGALSVPERRVSRRGVLAAGLAGLAVAAGGGLTWLSLNQKQQPARPVTPRPTATLPPLGMTIYTYYGHFRPVWDADWSPDGTRIASGSGDSDIHGDHTVQVWDAPTGAHVFYYRGHTQQVGVVRWSPRGKQIASGSYDGTVQVWDATSGHTAVTYKGHNGHVWAVIWSPLDGKYIASGGGQFDRTVQVWEAATGKHLFTYRGHSDGVDALAWSPNGKYIASGSHDQTVQVWEVSTQKLLFTYSGHTDQVWSVSWSPDGTRIASGGHDKTVQVWDALTGQNRLNYTRHVDWVNAVAWSPDGTRIASGAGNTNNVRPTPEPDTTVHVWDPISLETYYVYQGHKDTIEAVAWSPDATRLVSASDDYTAQVWEAK